MNIIKAQDNLIAKIQTLIDDESIDTSFTIIDNELNFSDLPLIIVNIDTTGITNLSSGGTAFSGFRLKLIVMDKITNHSNIFRTARIFIIDTMETILDNVNLDITPPEIKHEDGLWNNRKCVRVVAMLDSYGDN